MTPNLTRKIEELRSVEWCAQVGIPIAGAPVGQVSSWSEAVRLCTSEEWEDFRIDRTNEMTTFLHDCHPERYHLKWNLLIREVRTEITPLVETKLRDAISTVPLPKKVVDSSRWNIMHGCMEIEYEDVWDGGVYKSMLDWYIKGRFPCFWEGDYPQGNLVVY